MILVLKENLFGSVTLVYPNNYLLYAYYLQDSLFSVSGDLN